MLTPLTELTPARWFTSTRNPWIFYEWKPPKNKTGRAPPTTTAAAAAQFKKRTANTHAERLIILPTSSRATHACPVIAPSIFRSLRVHLCLHLSGRGLVLGGGVIYKQASPVPHAAGCVLASTWRSHSELNNVTMVNNGNKNKTNFLFCVGFPCPETAPAEGE